MKSKFLKAMLILSLSLGLAGCTFIFQKGRRSDIQKIEQLSRQVDELSQTKRLLEDRLSEEIKDKQVRLEMMEKGLVVTFMADVLFDSGRAKIKPSAYPILDKVALVLKENVPDLKVGIEGHTDNQPIRFSNWKTNWRLSTERALSVLDYLTDKKGLAPQRFSVIGCGEYQPVASNGTSDGRRLNRRVEVIILPQLTRTKVNEKAELAETAENLK